MLCRALLFFLSQRQFLQFSDICPDTGNFIILPKSQGRPHDILFKIYPGIFTQFFPMDTNAL